MTKHLAPRINSKNLYAPHLYLASSPKKHLAELFLLAFVEEGKSIQKVGKTKYLTNRVVLSFKVVDAPSNYGEYDAARVKLSVKNNLLESENAIVEVRIDNPFNADLENRMRSMCIPLFRKDRTCDVNGSVAGNRAYMYLDVEEGGASGKMKPSLLIPFFDFHDMKMMGEDISHIPGVTSNTILINKEISSEELIEFLVSLGQLIEEQGHQPNQMPLILMHMTTGAGKPDTGLN